MSWNLATTCLTFSPWDHNVIVHLHKLPFTSLVYAHISMYMYMSMLSQCHQLTVQRRSRFSVSLAWYYRFARDADCLPASISIISCIFVLVVYVQLLQCQNITSSVMISQLLTAVGITVAVLATAGHIQTNTCTLAACMQHTNNYNAVCWYAVQLYDVFPQVAYFMCCHAVRNDPSSWRCSTACATHHPHLSINSIIHSYQSNMTTTSYN